MKENEKCPEADLLLPEGAHQPRYHDTAGGLFGLYLKTLLLTIVTFGLYAFAARNRLRRYITEHVEIGGERLRHHGTAGELAKGASMLLLLLLLTTCVTGAVIGTVAQSAFKDIGAEIEQNRERYLAQGADEEEIKKRIEAEVQAELAGFANAVNLFYIAGGMLFAGFLFYAGLRYRANRTSWHELRGTLRGNAFKYGLLVMLHTVLNIITLGLFVHRLEYIRYGYIIDNASFGAAPLRFTGDAAEVAGAHYKTLLLAPFTLGLSRFWYKAATVRNKCAFTEIAGRHVRSDVTGGAYLRLTGGNLLILVITFGLGKPFIAHRRACFISRHFALNGPLRRSELLPENGEYTPSGDGAGGMFGDAGLI